MLSNSAIFLYEGSYARLQKKILLITKSQISYTKKKQQEGLMLKFVFTTLIFLSCKLSALDPEQALEKLVQGNTRFQLNKLTSQDQTTNRREELIDNQAPFAVIVACADSRVAPEIIFDQAIGDLFVVRVAGNVVGPFEMESIQYAVDALGSSCILVVGHKNCGAVNAVVQNQIQDIPYIAQMINPSVTRAKSINPPNLLKTSIEFNAEAMSKLVGESLIIKYFISQGKVKVYSGYYDFESGAVSIL